MQEIMSNKNDMILLALMEARKDMDEIKKDSVNPFHKSKYASLGAFINACDDALNNHGLILTQCGGGEHDKPFLISTLSHPKSNQWIRSYFPLLNPKMDAQGLGAAITYMRRYALSALLNLCAEKDDDGESNRAPEPKKQAPPKPPVPPAQNNPAPPHVEPLKQELAIPEKYKGFDEFVKKHEIKTDIFKSAFVSSSAAKAGLHAIALVNSLMANEKIFLERFEKWKSLNYSSIRNDKE